MADKGATYLQLPPDKCIHETFEWIVAQQALAPALVIGQRTYSYQELDQKANQLAHHLLAQDVQQEDLIAISMERSAEMIIGILGILKAGAAYLPIDPTSPTERSAYILEEAKVNILLTQKKLVDSFSHFKKKIQPLDADLSDLQDFPTTAVKVKSNSRQLAYTIFTSGSTGKPKGVQIEHHSVINLVQGQIDFVQLPVERFLYAYSFAFDGSVLLIFWTLLSGGTLVMAPEGLEKDIAKIADFIQQYQITHLLTFASLYGLLLERTDRNQLFSLKHVSVAGETCPPALIRKHNNTIPDAVLLNQYGPTEATVGATIYRTAPEAADWLRVPIGKTIQQVRAYILDEQLRQVPKGTIGELYLSGKGLARGYLNQPELSNEKFIRNPFDKFPFDRLYKTGDLALMKEDGNIDFIGRADFQVKLRGYRIEPGEIENVLTSHEFIREATVLLKGREVAEQKLIAYLVPTKGTTVNISELRDFLALSLPDYMIPAAFVLLEKMPLTTAGKVDRVALPEPGNERPLLAQSYVAPRNDLEKMLCHLWQDILKIEKVGIQDKFFELGGNSLQAADFVGRLQDRLGEVIFITSIFDHPTVGAFAGMLERDYSVSTSTSTSTSTSIPPAGGQELTSTSIPSASEQNSEMTSSPPPLAQHIGGGEDVISSPPRIPNKTTYPPAWGQTSNVSGKISQAVLTEEEFKKFYAYIPREKINLEKKSPGLKPAVFILAPPRSGTSLLRIMLAGHPMLFASNELQLLHFNTMSERAAAYQGKFKLWSEGLIRLLMELEQCTAEDATAKIQQYIYEGYSTKDMYALLQSKIGQQILVDKSPSYALDPDALQKAETDFENPIYIHLLRHPYAMVRSFTKMHMDKVMFLKEHPYTAQQLGELIWTRSHQNIQQFLHHIPASRQFQMQYEELVTQPEAVMSRLCAHLGWDYTPALIHPYKDLDTKMVDGLYQHSKPMGDIRLLKHGKIDPKLAEEWKGVETNNFLSPSTWSVAESLSYPPLAEKNNKVQPVENINTATSRDIAIIGMSVRVPGAETIEQFWANLKNGTDVSQTFTREDLQEAGLDPNLMHHPDFVNRGMPLENAGHFAAEFFGYLPSEAALMDPQHRVFLECAYTALEDAGYHSGHQQRIGIYGAVARNTYLVNNVITHPQYFQSVDDFQLGITLEKDFPATRVAYKLDLKGPALSIQTACSSSGVALHLACQSLLLDESDILLVGGGRIQPPVRGGHLHKEGHALSPDGYVRAFDAAANGMVRGHGMAFIVIKKLDKAMADGDTVHAVIKGSAIGNDGEEKIGFTAPSVDGQCRTIIEAYQKAKIDPATISYLEAHGTGTRLGDPIEVAALTKAFQQFTNKKTYCALGTVKTNIGHLDAGACIAGIIKTVLAMKAEYLPASLHFQKPNPQIPFEQSPFYVNAQGRDWKKGTAPRRAGVSSFGLGGTNVHIVLEEAPEPQYPVINADSELLVLSAKTPAALDQATVQLGQYLSSHQQLSLKDIAATLQIGRKAYAHRRILVAEDLDSATIHLQNKHPQFLLSNEASGQMDNIVFMFPGGGAQHTNMGLGLYQTESVFRETVDHCLAILRDKHELDLLPILYPPHAENDPITDPLHGICLLFIIELATAKLWMSKGVKPTAMIGHSLGEYVAACLAGIFTLEDALGLVAKRGQLFLTMEEGGMLSIPLSEKELLPYMDADLSFAAINKPDYCVVSGSVQAIERIKEKLTRDDIHAPRLHINVAAHSTMVESILDEFGDFLQSIEYQSPRIPIVSNLNGKMATNGTMQQPEYWKKHLRQTVRFSEGIETLLTDETKLFLEVGPGQTLSTFTRQHPKRSSKHLVIASLRHPKETISDRSFLLKSMGQLWLHGCQVDWTKNFENIHRISLPTYPFEREHYWITAKGLPTNISATPIANNSLTNMQEKENQSNRPPPVISRKTWLVGELKEIFHQLSGLPVGNMNDYATFLELGFDSLFLTQSLTKIKNKFGVKLNFKQLFEEAPTIDALAGYLEVQVQPQLQPQPQMGEVTELQPQLQPQPQMRGASSLAAQEGGQQTFVPNSNLEALIQQQLLLMQQQLELLRGGNYGQGNVSSVTPMKTDLPTGHVTTPAISNNPTFVGTGTTTKQEEFTSFGPWVPIEKKSRADLTEREKKYLDDLIQRYTAKTKGSQQLSERQRQHMADPRSIVGFNRMWKDMIYQIAMTHSKGSRLWDVDGHEYIDFRSSFGCNLFGNAPDFLQAAIKAQVDKGFELGVLTPLAEQVCDLICELTGTERASLVNTGSEAVSAAVRAARTATGKDKIIVFEGDYHGIADELLVKGISRNGQAISLPAAPGIPASLVEQVIVLKWDDPEVIQKIKQYAPELAAVLIEPIQPNNPTHQPKELMQAIRQVTEQEDVAMIFDEMITGFRLGPGGAQQWYEVEVDIIAYGKVLSGGLPMAAVAGKSRFLDVFDGGQWSFGDSSIPEAGVTFFGGTFCKHPVSLAAALAALTEIKKQGQPMYEALNEKSARFARRLIQLFEATKVPVQVLSTASIIAIRIVDKNPLSEMFWYYLRLKGIFIENKAALITLAHTEADLEHTYLMFEETIREMQTAGFFQITVAEVKIEHKVVSPPKAFSQQSHLHRDRYTSVKKKIALTEGQKEVWVEQQLGDAAAAAYNLSAFFHFHGHLQIPLLRKALQQLVDRHEALRTVYDRNELVQHVFPSLTIEIPFHDLSHLEEKVQKEELARLHQQETTEVLDLFEGPLFRVNILQLAPQSFQLLMTVHHGVADGWSCGILAKELSILYTALVQGKKAQLAPAHRLSEFVAEQQAFQQSEEAKETEAFWLSQFKTEAPILEFPTDYPRPLKKTYDAALSSIELEAELVKQLKDFSTQNRSTLFVTLYTAFQTLIHRLTGQDDFVLGVVAASQTISGNENLVAHGVSLLPLRTTIDTEDDFLRHLQKMRNPIFDAFEHQQYSLGNIVRALKLPRDPGRQPLISMLFNMDGASELLHFDKMQVAVSPIVRKYETFDAFINVKPLLDGSIAFEWIYNTDLFMPETIQRHLEEFKTLLESILTKPDAKIHQLQLLPASEKALLEKWNDTAAPYPADKLIHQLFEEQVQATPHRIAVFSEREKLTYQALNEQANQIARLLRSRGMRKGDFVGVYLIRDVRLLLGLMAVVKAGGIYVPLDPANPTERLRTIVEDADCRFLLTEGVLQDRLPTKKPLMICLDKEHERIKSESVSNLQLDIDPRDLVYVNYTSGSSGRPKGVLIPHYAVVDHHFAVQAALQLRADDVICSVASVAFDPSVQDYFLPLFLGASLTIVSEETKTDGFQLKDFLDKNQPTLMQATPSTWRMLLLAGWKGSGQLTILSGGEGLTKDLANKLITNCKRLYNIYGPTETTIWSTLKRVDEWSNSTKTISGYETVGLPLQNVQVYILDTYQNLVPIGSSGELYIGGVGVAPGGYFKREELSKEKFVPSPFSAKETLYRTGDIGRYLPNGDIEYLHRIDNQVKIRGYRIELGEIESVLARYDGIRECIVIIRENQSAVQRLVAYVVWDGAADLDKAALRNWLQEKLPEYMVPLDVVELEALPLTATGKVDRNKLPQPATAMMEPEKGLVAPTSKAENFLANLWKKLLSLSEVGIHDNFFELGGHSLVAVSMIVEIEKETGKRLPLSALLEYPTISRLAALLQEPQGNTTDEQQSHLHRDRYTYNSLVAIKKEGTKPPIYLVHGAGLHVLMFQTLAAHMDAEQPIYALQARGLDGNSAPLDNIEDIAAHYLSEILAKNPDGPYLLAGYSFGGLIAYEMARQLKAQGKEIAMLGMFDTVVRHHLSENGESRSYYQQLKELGKKVSFNVSILAKDPVANIKYKSHVLRRYYDRWKWKRKNGEQEPIAQVTDYSALVDQMNARAFGQYHIEAYDGEIYLFRAKEKRFYLQDFEYLGWKPFAKQGVHVREVPGDHLHLFNAPNGAVFAEVLQGVVDEVMGRRGRG